MRIAPDIADGIYDNRSSFDREKWAGGKLCGLISARMIVGQEKCGLPVEAWQHYPDVPRVNERKGGG